MWLRNRFVLLAIAMLPLALLAGCGSSTNNAVAPPSGAFSNTNFNGAYVFSVSGQDILAATGGGSIFAMAGSLTACGCTQGTISGGSIDLVDSSGANPGSTIGSNSTYSITKDGRGFARLFVTTTQGSEEVDIDFVLTSSSHGLIIRYDEAGTGSGTIDSQTSVSQPAAGSAFAFSLSGSDLNNNPLSTAGAFTLDGSGNISTSGSTAGVEDFTYQFPATAYPALPLSGLVQVGSGTAPGGATLSSSFGKLTFDVYPIDSTHFKLIENDSQAILVGDVFNQTSASIPQGNLVFTMSGLDPSANLFAAGGLMSSDGSSLIPSGSEDVNDAGTVDGGTNPATPYSFSGSFAQIPSGSGRFVFTLADFAGGSSFAAYPSSGGILMMEIDSGLNAGVTGGVALQQTSGAALTASQGYGMNLTGEDVIDVTELDEIAQFTTTSTGMTGLVDENDFGISTGTSNLSGSYTNGSDGEGSATFNAGLEGMFYYAADSSTVLFISTDPGQGALGTLEAQTTPSSDSALEHARALPMPRIIPHGHLASGHAKTTLGHAK